MTFSLDPEAAPSAGMADLVLAAIEAVVPEVATAYLPGEAASVDVVVTNLTPPASLMRLKEILPATSEAIWALPPCRLAAAGHASPG